jgi:hypothetical protein
MSPSTGHCSRYTPRATPTALRGVQGGEDAPGARPDTPPAYHDGSPAYATTVTGQYSPLAPAPTPPLRMKELSFSPATPYTM